MEIIRLQLRADCTAYFYQEYWVERKQITCLLKPLDIRILYANTIAEICQLVYLNYFKVSMIFTRFSVSCCDLARYGGRCE